MMDNSIEVTALIMKIFSGVIHIPTLVLIVVINIEKIN